MSASERLERLVEGFWEDTEPSGYEAPKEIVAALPKLVAAVKAAERIARSDYRSGQVYATKTDQDALDQALATLARKLEEAP